VSEGDPDLVEGIDFGEVNPVLDDLPYAITTNEPIEAHGDLELVRTRCRSANRSSA
jgi:hypothetical protein